MSHMTRASVSAAIGLLWGAVLPAAAAWKPGPPLSSPRFGLRAEGIAEFLYVLGGHEANDVATFERLNTLTGTWVALHPMTTPRNYAGSGVLRDTIYAVGGYRPGAVLQSSAEKYDPGADAWVPIADMPIANAAMASAVVGDSLYVFGGDRAPSATYRYDPVTNQWAQRSSAPRARVLGGAAAHNGLIYLVGGRTGATPIPSVDIYDPANDTWSTGPDLPVALSQVAVVEFAGRIWVMGGVDANDQASSAVYYLIPGQNTWTTSTSLSLPEAFSLAGAAVVGPCLYTAGGLTSSGAIASVYTLCSGNSNLVIYAPMAMPASADWFSTGIAVQEGDSVCIRVKGVANIGDPAVLTHWVGPNGVTVQSCCAPYPFNRFGVVGRLSGAQGNVFWVGKHHGCEAGEAIVAAASGELQFRLNDDFVADNTGVYLVEVHVHPRVPRLTAFREYPVFAFDPSQDWWNTGIAVNIGERVYVNAEGLVSVAGETPELHRVVDPDGVTPQPCCTPYRQFNRWALLGRINGAGARTEGTQLGSLHGIQPGEAYVAPATGFLELRLNDDTLVDNRGRLFIKVIVARDVLTGVVAVVPIPRPGSRGLSTTVYPNPFRSGAMIEADVNRPGEVSVDLFDISGRWVRHLEAFTPVPGKVKLTWDGRDRGGYRVPMGTYFYVVHAAGQQATSKAVLIE